MVTSKREISYAYRAERHPKDAYYLSSRVSSFINRFNRRGRKLVAVRVIDRVLLELRYRFNNRPLDLLITDMLKKMQQPMKLVDVRKGREMVPTPVTVPRRKSMVTALTLFTNTVGKRAERVFFDRLLQEIVELVHYKDQSATLRFLRQQRVSLGEARAAMSRRRHRHL